MIGVSSLLLLRHSISRYNVVFLHLSTASIDCGEHDPSATPRPMSVIKKSANHGRNISMAAATTATIPQQRIPTQRHIKCYPHRISTTRNISRRHGTAKQTTNYFCFIIWNWTRLPWKKQCSWIHNYERNEPLAFLENSPLCYALFFFFSIVSFVKWIICVFVFGMCALGMCFPSYYLMNRISHSLRRKRRSRRKIKW